MQEILKSSRPIFYEHMKTLKSHRIPERTVSEETNTTEATNKRC
jgi:hypothetical protein